MRRPSARRLPRPRRRGRRTLMRCVLPPGHPRAQSSSSRRRRTRTASTHSSSSTARDADAACVPPGLPTIVVVDDRAGRTPVPRTIRGPGRAAGRRAHRLAHRLRRPPADGGRLRRVAGGQTGGAARARRQPPRLSRWRGKPARSPSSERSWCAAAGSPGCGKRCTVRCSPAPTCSARRRAVAKLRPIGTALPSGRAAERLRYGLERLLVSRPEFDESALLDSLHGGSATLVGPEQAAALRLLGATGSSTADRLGLHALAMPRGYRARCTHRAGPLAADSRQPDQPWRASPRRGRSRTDLRADSHPTAWRDDRPDVRTDRLARPSAGWGEPHLTGVGSTPFPVRLVAPDDSTMMLEPCAARRRSSPHRLRAGQSHGFGPCHPAPDPVRRRPRHR